MKKTICGTEKRKIPLERRAHFYTLLTGVCASCGADSPDGFAPGLFCVTSFRQGAVPLAPLCGYPCGLCD